MRGAAQGPEELLKLSDVIGQLLRSRLLAFAHWDRYLAFSGYQGLHRITCTPGYDRVGVLPYCLQMWRCGFGAVGFCWLPLDMNACENEKT